MLLGGLVLLGVSAQGIQPPASPYISRQSDRPRTIAGDEPGFQAIFDGKTLAGWEGDRKYWRVEDGSFVGEITPATVVESNTFIIWRGGRPKDFELKPDYRITAEGNSGVNYTHIVNGRVMSVVVDDDASRRPIDGLIGVQVHVGPPMKVEYRNMRLKNW